MYVFIYAFNKNENTEHGFEGKRRGMSEGLEGGKDREKYWNDNKNLKEFHKLGN